MNDLGIFNLVSGDVPAQPVVGTNFTLAFSEATGKMTLAILAAPASTYAITHYRLRIYGAAQSFIIPVSAMPYSFDFTPAQFFAIWKPLVASWQASLDLSAISSAGEGPTSALVAVTIDQDDTWFIPATKYTYTEVRTGAVSGATNTAVGDVTIPAGWQLRYYPGPLAYADNRALIHDLATSPAIDAGSNETSDFAQTTGTVSHGVLLWYREYADQVFWMPAAIEKTLTIQGLIIGGLDFTVLPTINPVLGLYPIGSALSLAFTPTGNTLSTLYQWNLADLPIPGAQSATYTPVATDDLRQLTCDVTIRNGSTTLTRRTPAVSVTYAKPTVGSPIADVAVTQQSGVSGSFSLTGKFNGSNLTHKVSGSSVVTVNNSAPSVSYNRSAALSDTLITVTAENSGGSASQTFHIAITSTGSTTPPAVQTTIGGNNGGNTDVAFTDYLTNDMILAFVFQNQSAVPLTPPAIAGLTGQYTWAAAPNTAGELTSVSGAVFYRRAATDGLDGLQGPWPSGSCYRYVVVRGVDWSDPIGAALGVVAAGAANVDHPGLTLETLNSVVLTFAGFATGTTGLVPGLRPGATLLYQNAGSGARHVLASSASPVALWAAAADVANVGSTVVSGRSYAVAVEVRGATTASEVTWPADVPQAHLTVSEVTSPTENTAQGFTSGGHIKIVASASLNAAPTTVSGTFSLVRHVLGESGSTPDNTNPAITAGATAYTSSTLAVGDSCYPEAWWKLGSGPTAQYKKAWSAASFEIQGLDQPTVTDWPAAQFVGTATGEARSFGTVQWEADNANGQKNASYFGPAMAWAAYASFAGNNATDAYVIKCIKEGRDGAGGNGTVWGGPSLQMGFVGQHDLPYVAAVMWASKTPRIWSQFSAAWKSSLDLFMHGAAIAAAGCAREGNTLTPFTKNMLGRVNPSSNAGHNIGTPPAAIVAACAAYFGGAATLKAYLDSVIVADFVDTIAASPWTNMAASFASPRASGAPTIAQLQARIRNWTRWGFSITEQDKIWEEEMASAYVKACVASLTGNANGIQGTTIATAAAGAYSKYAGATKGGAEWAYGRGRAKNYAGLIADPDYIAIAGKIGAVQETNMMDAGGHRLSGSYAMWSIRIMWVYTLIVFTMGLVNPKSARATALRERMFIGSEYMRLTSDYGFLSVAHIVKGGLPASPEGDSVWKAGGADWSRASLGDTWGMDYSFDMYRVIEAIFDMP